MTLTNADIKNSRKLKLKSADIKTTLDRLTLKNADIKNTLETMTLTNAYIKKKTLEKLTLNKPC